MANSPKDDTDLSAIPLKKLDAILNQIQKQNALISEQGSQINELSTENEKLRSELKKRGDRNDYLTSLLARANKENKRRNEIVEGFKSMLFKVGQTSEAGIVSKFLQSTKQEEIQEQPSIQTSIFGEDNAIFNEIEIMAPHANTEKELDIPEDKKQTTNKTKFKKKKLSLISEDLLSLNLPVETLYLDDIEKDSICPICKATMKVIGEEVVTRKLKYLPAKWSIEEVRRRTYKCLECESKNRKALYKPNTPEALLPHSVVSPSVLSHVVTQKFVSGLPFYRQEQMMVSNGIPLTRNILTSWCMKVFENQLAPLCDLIKGELLTNNHYIHADETRIEVLNSEGCKKPKQAYMWVYTTTKWNSKSIRFFEYANGRGGKFPKEFLKDYQGYLHTDCYGGYNDLEDSEQTPKYSPPKNNKKIKRCLCLVHLRRYFVDALEGKNKGKLEDSLNNKLALKAISMLDRVFANEREYKALTAEERQKARLENTKPILEEFFEWCINVEASNACLPKGKLGKAYNYALKGKEDFMTFLKDGNCDVSNNTVENAIRPFVIGRKNYLFHITDNGAKVSAGYYSLVETAKANGLAPQRYLEWILEKLPSIRPKTGNKALEELLPWSESVPTSCKANTMEALRSTNQES